MTLAALVDGFLGWFSLPVQASMSVALILLLFLRESSRMMAGDAPYAGLIDNVAAPLGLVFGVSLVLRLALMAR